MAAGGTFTVQNKTRPGIYFRFRSKNGQNLTIGDRGVVAIPEPLSWGPTATVIELDSGADPMPLRCRWPTGDRAALCGAGQCDCCP